MFLVQEPSPSGWPGRPHPLNRGIISPTWSLGKLTERTVWLMSKTLGPYSYQRDFRLVFSLLQFPLAFTNVESLVTISSFQGCSLPISYIKPSHDTHLRQQKRV